MFPSRLRGYLLPALFVFFITFALWRLRDEQYALPFTDHAPHVSGPHRAQGSHPIDRLRAAAENTLEKLLASQTTEDAAAAKAYERRRGRRPPPGFDKWMKFAREHDAVIVEDFFDRIYDDLNPFWAMEPRLIRQISAWHYMRIEVRDGKVNVVSHYDAPWMKLWGDLVSSIAADLPDLNMAINDMDEPRIIVPWEDMSRYMKAASASRRIAPSSKLISTYGKTIDTDGVNPFEGQGDIFVHDGRYWNLTWPACDPKSPARANYVPTFDFHQSLPWSGQYPPYSHGGYVANWTLAKSPCDYPLLQQMHGSFIEPLSLSTTQRLIPMFGGSKTAVNNEILLPAAMYWSDEERFTGHGAEGGAWEFKKDQLVWRGTGTGGKSTEESWTRYQRHRFVSMVNATTVSYAENTPSGLGPNFVLPDRKAYDLKVDELGPWVDECADVAFGAIMCFPANTTLNHGECEYNQDWFDAGHSMSLEKQFTYKYLPDIDGNSYSGRYRAFLLSSSLPLKATVYNEWHDSRLVPWKHFVPMDNTFTDMFGIMEYFMGTKGHDASSVSADSAKHAKAVQGHDEAARNIAVSGKQWAEKVLRKDDMQVYVYRLLLEFGRLCDDNRDHMGWIPQSNSY